MILTMIWEMLQINNSEGIEGKFEGKFEVELTVTRCLRPIGFSPSSACSLLRMQASKPYFVHKNCGYCTY